MEKCNFAETEAQCLGFQFSQTVIQPLNGKIQVITDRLQPDDFKGITFKFWCGEPDDPI